MLTPDAAARISGLNSSHPDGACSPILPRAFCSFSPARNCKATRPNSCEFFDWVEPLQVLSEEDFVPMQDPVACKHDVLDIATKNLPVDKYPRFGESHFLSTSWIDDELAPSDDHVYVAFGFPVARAIGSVTEKHIQYQPVSLTCRSNSRVLKKFKLSTTTHIGLEFDRKDMLIRGGGRATAP